ncbi:MAG TPA: T9SS type A sorting domain-containing protein, partial [Niastella sp.]
PAAFTCNACCNYNLAPTGTTNSCGSAANAQNNIVLLIPDKQPVSPPTNNTSIKEVAIYPNPANKYIFLQLPKGHTYTTMTVFSQSGQQVHGAMIKAGNEPNRYELPALLPRGLYFIQLIGKKETLTLRMVKE